MPNGRDRRIPSRDARALSHLLDPGHDDAPVRRRASSASTFEPRSSRRGAVQLRDGVNFAGSPYQNHLRDTYLAELGSLRTLFGNQYDDDVLTTILDSCGGDIQRSIDAVLAFGASDSANADVGGSSGSGCGGRCLWDEVPDEVKAIVFAHLSLWDLAKAAATSREFAEYVRRQRDRVRSIQIPRRLSLRSVRGMVAAHRGAVAVSLASLGAQLAHADDFEGVFHAVAAGAADRAGGSRVECIDLRGCSALTDGDVGQLCITLPNLREVTVSNCPLLGDDAMAALSRYSRRCATPGGGGGLGPGGDDESAGDLPAELAARLAPSEAGDLQRALQESLRMAHEEQAAAPGVTFGSSSGGSSSGGFSRDAAASAVDQATASPVALAGAAESAGGQPRTQGRQALGATVVEIAERRRREREAAVAGQQPPGAVSSTHSGGLPSSTAVGAAGPAAHAAAAAAVVPAGGQGGGLQVVRAAGLDGLTEAGVQLLLNQRRPSARSLRELDASRAPRLSRLALELCARHTLQRLRAGGCRNLRLVRLRAPAQVPLESVHLAQCPALEEVDLGSATLSEVNASGCARLRRLTLACPALRRLTASGCAALREVGTGVLLPSAGGAAAVVGAAVAAGGGGAGGAAAAVAGMMPELREVNLFSCRSLTSAGLAGLAGRCPGLRDLNLGGCTGLGPDLMMVQGLGGSLQRVDVSGCQSLSQLALASPALRSLEARGCSSLQEVAIDAPPCLLLLDLKNCGQLRRVSLPAVRGEEEEGGQARGGPTADAAGPAAAVADVLRTPKLRVVLDGCPQLGEGFYRQMETLRRRAAAASAAGASPAAASAARSAARRR